MAKRRMPAHAGERTTPAGSWWEAIRSSLVASIGDVVFGMEDGSVSIFGLVFGVAVSAANTKAVVLAGAAGAAAAAVSMAAGAYLDVESARSIASAQVRQEAEEIKTRPQKERQEITRRLQDAGFTAQQVATVLQALTSHAGGLLRFEEAFELEVGKIRSENPYAHAFWMFAADLIAAFTPVTPFFFLPLAPARIVSIIVTGTLLFAVGIGRGIVSHRNVWLTALETLVIATAAAIAGVLIGRLLTR